MTPYSPTRASTTRAAVIGALVACLSALAASAAVAADFEAHCAKPPTTFARSRAANPATLLAVLSAARAGDLIVLDSGTYGQVNLIGDLPGFVGVTARDSGRAIVSSLTVKGGHWLIRGLVVDGASSGGRSPPPTQPGKWPGHDWLVRIAGADNVVFTDNVVASRQGDFPWQEETLGVDDPAPLANGVIAENGACVTLSHNRIFNVFNGVYVGGDQVGDRGRFFRVVNNAIENFAADGIDHSLSASLIAGNVITRAHDICHNQCIHMDAIQGWNYGNRSGITNVDVTIDGNTIIQDMATDDTLPADNLQGITIFDGFWRDVKVVNNVIATDAWHGITIGGVDGLILANNTVLATTPRGTWISAGGTTHQGSVSRNVVVRNNIASVISQPKIPVENMKVDHNLIADDPRALFVDFRPAQHIYDMRLSARSRAIGRGAAEDAPDHDIDGAARSATPDLGAYQQRR